MWKKEEIKDVIGKVNGGFITSQLYIDDALPSAAGRKFMVGFPSNSLACAKAIDDSMAQLRFFASWDACNRREYAIHTGRGSTWDQQL